VTEDVFRRARELEERLFGWMSRANRQDVVQDEDGPRCGDTDRQAESAAGGADATERELVEFLRLHRWELESDPYWQVYIEDLDRAGLLARPQDPDPAQRRRAERAEWARGSSATPPPAAPDPGRPRGLSR